MGVVLIGTKPPNNCRQGFNIPLVYSELSCSRVYLPGQLTERMEMESSPSTVEGITGRHLVYFYCRGAEKKEPNLDLLIKDIPGLVSTEYYLVRRVLACNFTNSDVNGNVDELRMSFKKQELNECSHISAPLSHDNRVCVLSVGGMTCQSCVKLIETTVGQLPGVRSVKVSLEHNEAFVEHDPSLIQTAELNTTIYDMGFDASVTATYNLPLSPHHAPPLSLPPTLQASRVAVIAIEGMTCSSCTQNIESNISKATGVESIKVSLQDKNAEVVFDPEVTNPQKLACAIDELGFEAKVGSQITSSCLTGNAKGEEKVVYIGIDGMTCHSCVKVIESQLEDVEGVVSISVSLSCKEGVVRFNSALTSVAAISQVINNNKKFCVIYMTGEFYFS